MRCFKIFIKALNSVFNSVKGDVQCKLFVFFNESNAYCLEYEFTQCLQEKKSQCICDRKDR